MTGGQDGRIPWRNPLSADNKNQPVHRWVNWIAGFSGEFAGAAIDYYLPPGPKRAKAVVLDPFAGVGTTLVEAQRRGIRTVGFEINPFPQLAATAKLEIAGVEQTALRSDVLKYVQRMVPLEIAIDVGDTSAVPQPRHPVPPGFRSRVPFFSPSVQLKVLLTLDFIDTIRDKTVRHLFKLAFATTMVSFSNYSYEPSLSSREKAGKPPIPNAPVSMIIAEKLLAIIEDVALYKAELNALGTSADYEVHLGSFFDWRSIKSEVLGCGNVDLVVTSPPYLNNYHYVRNTRPHLFWLNYVSNSGELNRFEIESFGKYWQTVRDADSIEVGFRLPQLDELIDTLRQVNPEKRPYGGRGWANYAATYFNDSYRFLRELQSLLRPGGTAIVVVGNNLLQGIEFRVDEILVRMAQSLGLEGRTELVRNTRVGSSIVGTGSRQKMRQQVQLYDAAVILRQPA